IRSMGSGYTFSVNVLISWDETQVPELQKLAALRNRYVQEAIATRLPPDVPAGTATLLHTVAMGACMQWVAAPEQPLADYVLRQVAELLRMIFPEHDGFNLPA